MTIRQFLAQLKKFVLLIPSIALFACGGNDVDPPQGYLSFDRSFTEPSVWNGDKDGFFNFDFDFVLHDTSSQLAGTFWANNFTFRDSDTSLPSNHVGGDQGGYLGVQIIDSNNSIAIFSVWWAQDAEAGPGATCIDGLEAWYNDSNPFDPPITNINSVDPSRPLAGGPFMSCRLPIDLVSNARYRLRLWVLSEPGDWWGAWLINVDTGDEQFIGKIQLPNSWQWLNASAGGFIEHFGPMPDGCDSIPASESTYFAATADNGITSSLSANLYGDCMTPLSSRTNISCASGQCDVSIR
jgi:hypothetical protein